MANFGTASVSSDTATRRVPQSSSSVTAVSSGSLSQTGRGRLWSMGSLPGMLVQSLLVASQELEEVIPSMCEGELCPPW